MYVSSRSHARHTTRARRIVSVARDIQQLAAERVESRESSPNIYWISGIEALLILSSSEVKKYQQQHREVDYLLCTSLELKFKPYISLFICCNVSMSLLLPVLTEVVLVPMTYVSMWYDGECPLNYQQVIMVAASSLFGTHSRQQILQNLDRLQKHHLLSAACK